MTKTTQSQRADFAPGFCNGSVQHVVVASAPAAQFAVTVYGDEAEKCGATWRIRWKFMTTCSTTVRMLHAIGAIMAKCDVIYKTGSTRRIPPSSEDNRATAQNNARTENS